MRAPSRFKAKQIVDQPPEAAGARVCLVRRFGERSVSEGAVLLWHKAIPPERRKALTTRRAAAAQPAAVAKARQACCQGSAAPEVWHLVFP